MKTRYSILSALSLAAFAATAFVGGCSSDDAASTLPTTVKDAGTTKDATAATDSGTTTADAGTPPVVDSGPAVVDAGCDSRLAIKVRDGGGLYCSYGGIDAGPYCQPGETCCANLVNGSNKNSCGAASACNFDAGAVRAFSCTQASDCTGGDVCCGIGDMAPKTGCTYDQASMGHKGTACKASCAATGEERICTNNSECVAPKTCKAATIYGTFVGVCR